jgi:hypothetical protein
MSAPANANEIEEQLKRSAVREWGWALFGAAGVLCLLTYPSVFLWTANFPVGDSRFWMAAVVCGIPSLVAGLGFLQGVSTVTIVRLPGIWRTLRPWQRLVIIAFIGVAVGGAVVSSYYLVSLDPSPKISVAF